MQINLSRKGMVDFDASAFSTKEERDMLYAIARLDASMNRLVSVKGMQCLQNLTVLDVSRNRIRSLSGLPLRLRRLTASHNDIASVEALSPLSQLEFVDVSHNAVTVLTGLPSSTGALKVVNAAHNRIGTARGLEHCTALRELLLDHNFIARVDDLAPLKHLRCLESLTIGDNPVAAAPRNVAAMRLILPRSAAVEGLPAVAAAASATGPDATGASVHHRSATAQVVRRSATPPSVERRERSGSSGSASGGASRVRPRSTSADPRPGSRALAAAPGHRASLYHSLLQETDLGGGSNSNGRGVAPAKTPGPGPAQHRSKAEPAAAGGVRRSSTPPSRPNPLDATTRATRAPLLQQMTSSLANASLSIHDTSAIGCSAAASKAQRLLEERVAELEAQLRTTRGQLAEAQREAANYKLQVTQLRETVERQGQVNLSLLGSGGGGVGEGRSEVAQQRVAPRQPSPGRRPAAAAAVPPPRVSVAPAASPSEQPPSWTAKGSRAAPSTAARAATHSSGVRRRRAASPKRADSIPPPADTPALSGAPSGERTPPHNTSVHSANSRRNVSFGGSSFHSPPEYYYR